MEYVYGKNTVIELIKSKNEVAGIYLEDKQSKKPYFKEIFVELKKSGRSIPVGYKSREELIKLSGSPENQGVIAEVPGFKKMSLGGFLKENKNVEKSFLFLLDCIHDPHNMGAIIRSAYAMGVTGCVVFDKRSAKINSTVAKTSAGALFHIPIICASGVLEAIANLKNDGYQILGCEMTAEKNVFDEDFTKGKYAVILGNEGEGLAGKTSAKVDREVRIPMPGQFESLNVSVTAGILAYEYMRQNVKN
ncbi:MAG: 23S rRNA (guanosine(2251)-2'-O)-methyltransferase RlmB [Candidatus Wallbacteria bacterium]